MEVLSLLLPVNDFQIKLKVFKEKEVNVSPHSERRPNDQIFKSQTGSGGRFVEENKMLRRVHDQMTELLRL